MSAIILDNARINSYTLIAAGSVVRSGGLIPEGVMVGGVPARIVRDLPPEERAKLEESAQYCADYVKSYRESA